MLDFLIPDRPRVAGPASRAWNTAKTAAQIVVMWSVILGLLPLTIERFERILGLPSLPPMTTAGSIIFILASVCGLVTANVLVRDGDGTPLPLDTARRFVVSGPYRHVRNPMAMFGFTQGVGVGLWFGSPGVLVYTAIGAMIWQRVARPWEEADLEARFGDRYRRYRSAVACWIPRLRPYEEDTATMTDSPPAADADCRST
jgi:protein-S-isoprenylcysteine O-methyltransferase Ste14